jgi:hypothetical protein
MMLSVLTFSLIILCLFNFIDMRPLPSGPWLTQTGRLVTPNCLLTSVHLFATVTVESGAFRVKNAL